MAGAAPSVEAPARSALEQARWLARHPRRTARQRARYRRIKRVLDVTAVLATAPGWVPVLALAAAAVKVDARSGDVLFRQLRTGTGGARFELLKLRTMVPGADRLKASLQHLNLRTWPDFKIEDDPRITRVGRFLRASSLDELPQLVNVLRGDMSLVGPRPTTMPAELYEEWQRARFAVPSGLTGLWQVTGRGSPSFADRIRLDLAYADRQSARLDLEILVRTVPAVLARRGV